MTGIRARNRDHTPRKRPTQERSRATVEAIVEAAARVFEEQGYTDTTTDRVAERAGVSIGSLYQYFPNKDALLVALFERHLREIAPEFDRITSALERRAPLDQVVRDMVTRLFALHRAAPRLHRIFVEEAPMPQRLLDEYALLEEGVRAAWVAYLGERIADPDLAALMTMTFMETMAHRYTLYPPAGRTQDELERGTIAMIIAYLQSDE